MDEDVRNIKENGGNILICTPGRLEDLLSRKKDLNLPVAVKSLVNRNQAANFEVYPERKPLF